MLGGGLLRWMESMRELHKAQSASLSLSRYQVSESVSCHGVRGIVVRSATLPLGQLIRHKAKARSKYDR